MDFEEFETVEKKEVKPFDSQSSRDNCEHNFNLENIKVETDELNRSGDWVNIKVEDINVIKIEEDDEDDDDFQVEVDDEGDDISNDESLAVNNNFYCKSCDFQYDNKKALLNHYVFTHPNLLELEKTSYEVNGVDSAIDEVLENQHHGPPIEIDYNLNCRKCNFEYGTITSLINHFVLNHPNSVELERVLKAFSKSSKLYELRSEPIMKLNDTHFAELRKICEFIFENAELTQTFNTISTASLDVGLKKVPNSITSNKVTASLNVGLKKLPNSITSNKVTMASLDVGLNKVPNSISSVKLAKLANRIVVCKKCKLNFRNYASFSRHYRSFHLNKDIGCNLEEKHASDVTKSTGLNSHLTSILSRLEAKNLTEYKICHCSNWRFGRCNCEIINSSEEWPSNNCLDVHKTSNPPKTYSRQNKTGNKAS